MKSNSYEHQKLKIRVFRQSLQVSVMLPSPVALGRSGIAIRVQGIIRHSDNAVFVSEDKVG
jgi:hypothetical protein